MSKRIVLALLLILSSVFLTIGLVHIGTLLFYGTWKEAQGKVIESRVVTRIVQMPSGKSYFYDNYFLYQYQVENKFYTSRKLGNFTYTILDTVTYKLGSIVPVKYNPLRPSSSIIEVRKEPGSIIFGVLGIILLITYFILKRK
ncbi:MAG: DUF3592 domain-containing protein [Schleiferiaceae bacterium]|nr:DUF3592 domain-containing protein [Schleiferiaceae bacterium]